MPSPVVLYSTVMAYSILIVDDENVIREGLKQVVSWEQLGFTIAGAVSSVEEIASLQHTTTTFSSVQNERWSMQLYEGWVAAVKHLLSSSE